MLFGTDCPFDPQGGPLFIRENIKAAPDKSAYQVRLLQKLSEQETQIEGLFKQQDEAQKLFEQKRKELEDYVSNLNVD